MPSGELKIAIWQDSGHQGDISANLFTIEAAAKNAQNHNVELLIFPECFLTGYFRETRVRELAIEINDDVIGRLKKIATLTNVALLVGSYEQSGAETYNSAVCISPTGGEIARYRKRALYGDWEKSTFKRGDRPVVFEYRGFKIGILICFDIEFPELARELALLNVDLIAIPTSLMTPYENIARHVVPARAIENQVFVAYANRTGSEMDLEYVGESCICSPSGEFLANASDDENQMIIADIQIVSKTQVRSEFSYISELSLLV